MSDIRAMYGGLSQQVPLSTLTGAPGLAGPAPSAQSPRGGAPAGLDPSASMFRGLEQSLKQSSDVLEREGTPKSLRMANELDAMAVKVNKMALEHQTEVATRPPQTQGAAAQYPNINAGGIAR